MIVNEQKLMKFLRMMEVAARRRCTKKGGPPEAGRQKPMGQTQAP